MACGDLYKSSVLDCNNILQGGIGGDSRLVLILKKDIDSYTSNGFDEVTAITLAASKSAYSFDGIMQSLKPKFEIAKSASGQTVYKHVSEFLYFEYDQQAKNNLRQMGNGRYVAIYENAKQDANAFEILGLDSGLVVTEGGRAPQENGGAIRIVLASPENEFEAKPPRTLGAATYTAARAIVDGLLALPTITTLAPTAATSAGGTALTLTGTNFYGGGVNSAVTKIEYVNNTTGAIVTQVTYTVVSTTSITMNSVAMVAGSYKVRVTTLKGAAEAPQNLIVT